MGGFFLLLSGDLDSASTAMVVFSMCRLAVSAAKSGNQKVCRDMRRIAGEKEDSERMTETPQEFCARGLAI